MTPERKDLKVIEGWTSEQFGSWLHGSVRDYYLSNKGRHAFKPLGTFFGWDYDVAEEFMHIFRLMTESEKSNFRKGLAIALQKIELTKEWAEVVDVLLALVRYTEAREVLNVLDDQFVALYVRNISIDDYRIRETIQKLGG